MATTKIKAIKSPKVAIKLTKASKIGTGSVTKPSKTVIKAAKNVSIPKPTVKAVGLIKEPKTTTTAPKNAFTRPKTYAGQKPTKGI